MQAYDKAAPVVKEATDTAAPYVKKGLDVAGEVARPVIRAAEPVVKVGHPSLHKDNHEAPKTCHTPTHASHQHCTDVHSSHFIALASH